MKIIDRYILAQFLKLFIGSLVVLVTLFTAISFFDLIDDFMAHHAAPALVIHYFILKLPEAAFFMTPMAVLIASILTYSLLSRNHEFTIMMSCGLSVLRITAPVLSAAFLLSYLSFLNGDLLIPASWEKAHKILKRDIKKQSGLGSGGYDRIWLKAESGAVWSISHIDMAAKKLRDITILEFSGDMSHFSSIIKARSAFQENDGWVFENGIIRDFDGSGGFMEKPFEKKSFDYDVDFSAIKRFEKKTQAMSFGEIRSYIKRIREAGYDDTRYRVDMYVKIAFPLVGLVMAFIAMPFGLKTDRRAGGFMGGISIAVLLGFIFWFLFSMGVSLGHSGKFPPLLAAMGAHMLFMLASGYMIIARYYPRH